MFDRFTDRARYTMVQARVEAERLNQDFIRSEHILLGLLHDSSSVAAAILHELGHGLETVRKATEKVVRPPTNIAAKDQLPFSPEAKRLLEAAMDEARSLQHTYLGTEHLLLGAIVAQDSKAAQVLFGLGIGYQALRAQVIQQSPARRIPPPFGPERDPHDIFSRCSDHARNVFTLAHKTALEWRNDYIGTEHMLMGICQEGEGVAVHVMENLDVPRNKIAKALEKHLIFAPDPLEPQTLPFTPRGKRVLDLAADEADAFGHAYIGTEHLLLALLKEGEGLAAKVLKEHGLTYADVRAETIEFLGGSSNRRFTFYVLRFASFRARPFGPDQQHLRVLT